MRKQRGIPLIEDAAQALGGVYRGERLGNQADYTIFSFQAVKHLTTGDGGMLMVRDPEKAALVRRLRWFGIDRTARVEERSVNDITEIGYKYQMTDIGAALGLASLRSLDERLAHRRRRRLSEAYRVGLARAADVELVRRLPLRGPRARRLQCRDPRPRRGRPAPTSGRARHRVGRHASTK